MPWLQELKVGMTRGALPQRRIETQGARNRKVYKVKETLPTPHVLLVRHAQRTCMFIRASIPRSVEYNAS